ncbi:MAG: glycosyltransferase involved in cell wall biosynthesis, partial [Flavobacteriales bacterium]
MENRSRRRGIVGTALQIDAHRVGIRHRHASYRSFPQFGTALATMIVDVIIPAFNEAGAIGLVVQDIADRRVRRVVVVDNGSTDATSEVAREAGATAIREPRMGYGRACLTGLAHLSADPPDVVAFIDGDRSDYPEEMSALLDEIERGSDMVIGSRATGVAERGSLTPVQVFGNWLSTRLISRLYGQNFTDLGPFRAITWDALQRIDMRDEAFGWTVEMQVKAAKNNLKCSEIPVRYRRRIGVSK